MLIVLTGGTEPRLFAAADHSDVPVALRADESASFHSNPDDLAASPVPTAALLAAVNRMVPKAVDKFSSRVAGTRRLFALVAQVVEDRRWMPLFDEPAAPQPAPEPAGEAESPPEPAAPHPPQPEPEAAPAPTAAPARGRTARTARVFPAGRATIANPRRTGSLGHAALQWVRDNPGGTVEEYVRAGHDLKHLRWDIAHNNVRLQHD